MQTKSSMVQRLEAHMSFICPECGETFETQQLWRQHLNYFHDYLIKKPVDFGFIEINERYHECKICKAMVADGKRAIALLQYHSFLHLPFSRTYGCRYCSATYIRKSVLCEHLQRSHEQQIKSKANSSPSLGEKSDTTLIKAEDSLQRLSTAASSSKISKGNPEFYMRYICPQCGRQLETFRNWMDHISKEHSSTVRPDCEMQRVTGTKNHYCKICRKVVFSNEMSKLQRHYYSHMPYRVNFQCAYCKVRRAYKTEILHHFIRTHLREFETHRHNIQKPQEWGAPINEPLNKEVDLLLQSESNPVNLKGLSTTLRNRCQSSAKMELTKSPTSISKDSLKQQGNNKGDIVEQALLNSLIDLERETAPVPVLIKPKRSHSISFSHTQIKRKFHEMEDDEDIEQPSKRTKDKEKQSNTLEALCAEIFNDIDGDDFDSYATEAEKRDSSLNNVKSELDNNNGNEQILSIEINTLDESELNEYKEMENEHKIASKSAPSICNSPKGLYNSKVLHLCPECGEKFSDQCLWRNHVLTAHDLNRITEEKYKLLDDQISYLCLTCMRVLYTTNKQELQRHAFSHMPYHAYLKCSICGSCKSTKSKMMQHLESNHSEYLKISRIYQERNDYQRSTPQVKIEDDTDTQEDSEHSLHLDSTEFLSLMTHLRKARDRLNRLAAECGLSRF